MSFTNPSAFILLIPLAVLIMYKKNLLNSLFHVSEKMLPQRQPAGFYFDLFSKTLFLLSIVTLITALSSPSLRSEKKRYLSSGNDYFFILDVSPSMSILDSGGRKRIDTAKEMILKFREERGNDCPGLILFSDEAFLSVPPTPDYRWFDEKLKSADIIYPDRGTALGDSVALACFYLRKNIGGEKFAILFSDGGGNTGSFSSEAASEIAFDYGIRIYTIAMGSGLSDANYQPEQLRKIASLTGGLFFEGDDAESLESAVSFIGRIEKRERTVEKVIVFESRTDLFLIAGFIFLFLSLCIRSVVLRDIEA